MNNIYLVGMPGCGKSAIGNALSLRLGYILFDTDIEIEKLEGNVAELIVSKGEHHFRDIESAVLETVSREEKAIISTGGGIILRQANVEVMKNTGLVVFIDRPPLEILRRFDFENHPLSRTPGEYYELLRKRLPLYRQAADIILPAGTDACETADRLLMIGSV